MAEISVSYTAEDKPCADWIGLELEELGHTRRAFDGEVSAGGDAFEWIDTHLNDAHHVLCIVSSHYLKEERRYSAMERRALRAIIPPASPETP